MGLVTPVAFGLTPVSEIKYWEEWGNCAYN